MLTRVGLNFGSVAGGPSLEFEPGPMTIFVGPNNSGKSLLLNEIYSAIQNAPERKIVRTVLKKRLTKDAYRQLLLSLNVEEPPSPDVVEGYFPDGQSFSTHLRVADHMSEGHEDIFRDILTRGLTIAMSGQARLTPTNPYAPPASNLGNWRYSHIGRLFNDKAVRKRLNEVLQKALNLYLTIDPTDLRELRVLLSRRSPQPPGEDEWAMDERGRRFFRQAEEIGKFSDGVRAFIGMMMSILSAPYMVMLVDEPEAFLHPPLIKELALNLTEIAAERDANIFAATHSPDFVMGCVQTNRRINIIRLTYKQGVGTATYLPAAEVQQMMRNPFLRSAGVLSSLFYEGAVVGESDVDRAFYQEINQRNVEVGAGGMRNVVFLNANGKDSLRHIIAPLRRMGIPAAAVVDLDIIEPGTFKLLLESANVPRALIDTWAQLKDKINDEFKRLNIRPKTTGLGALGGGVLEAANAIIISLSDYGIFLVSVGEVEGWLPELEAKGKATYWLEQIFTKMGDDPSSADYVKPTESGVWDFLRRIGRWIDDPARKGMSLLV
jgi:ABC-type cobalamin/Fe3+-siderophores transport system ATPase subunit